MLVCPDGAAAAGTVDQSMVEVAATILLDSSTKSASYKGCERLDRTCETKDNPTGNIYIRK